MTNHSNIIYDEISYLKKMIESCFTYGGAERTSYNFERYIKKYQDSLGTKLFDEIYTEHLELLNKEYMVKENVYSDTDGLNYNSLIKLNSTF